MEQDPAHQAFKTAAADVLENVIVVDFQEGVFTHSETVEKKSQAVADEYMP